MTWVLNYVDFNICVEPERESSGKQCKKGYIIFHGPWMEFTGSACALLSDEAMACLDV